MAALATEAGVVDATTAAPPGAFDCKASPSVRCDFDAICLPVSSVGAGGYGLPAVVSGGGPDGTRAFFTGVGERGGTGVFVMPFRDFTHDTAIPGPDTSRCVATCEANVRVGDGAVPPFVLVNANPGFNVLITDDGFVQKNDLATSGASLGQPSTAWRHIKVRFVPAADGSAMTEVTLSGADTPTTTTSMPMAKMPSSVELGATDATGAARVWIDDVICGYSE
jgi:hypothetical protein